MKVKTSALALELRTDLKNRPVVLLTKNTVGEVVDELITPKLNDSSQSIATVSENVVGAVNAISLMEDTVKDSNVHYCCYIDEWIRGRSEMGNRTHVSAFN